jgi:hypothetical protein
MKELKPNAVDFNYVLEKALLNAQEILVDFTDKTDFESSIQLAFGNKVDLEQAKFLINEFAKKDYTVIPTIEIRSAAEINGANGAFAGSNNTIYLSREFLEQNANNIAALSAVLVEEFGHFIDYQLNASDTPGDEGELFADLVREVEVTEGELQRLKVEDDSAVVIINGQSIQVEQANYNLRLVEGDWIWDDSVSNFDYGDNWTFEISTLGETNNFVSVFSDDPNVDLILDLYDAFGNFLGQSNFNNSLNNYEAISLENLPPGVYKATVYDGFQGYYLSMPYP